MSDTDETGETRTDWREAVEDRVWARWRWLLGFVVVVFVLNNLVGLIVGGLGAIAFAHRLAGQALRAGRIAQQVREIVVEPERAED